MPNLNVTLSDLEYVDCDECGAVGKYRKVGRNHFMCKKCGAHFVCTPCPPDCPDHIPAPETKETPR